MKKLLFIILILLSTSHCFSQQLEIISVEAKPMDLYGRVNEKLDLNGNKCAVIKVQVDDDIIDISGMIGKVISQGIEKSIYVTQETKKIKIKFAKHLPITIDPKEYGIDKLIGGCTYEIYLKSEKEKHIYTVEKSSDVLPEWINNVKDGQFVGISMPNNNVAAAKKQALAMATLQYVIYNGGAKVKTEINFGLEEQTTSNGNTYSDEFDANTSYISSSEYSNFAVNIAREYYNINGEYFVLCDFLKEDNSRNTIKIETISNYHRNALEKGTGKSVTATEQYLDRNLFTEIIYWINGIKCNMTSTYNYSDNKQENTTRIDGDIVFNKGYKYPDINLFTELKKQTIFERLDLSSNSIGYSQLCFVMSIPFLTKKINIKTKANFSSKSDENFDTWNSTYIIGNRIYNNDTLSIPIKVKWGGIRNNQLYYSNFSPKEILEQNLIGNICQYSLDANIPSIIISKHFSFVEALENICLCCNESDSIRYVNVVAENNDYIWTRIDEKETEINIKNIHLFPIFTSNDKKFNNKFNGVIVCSNDKLPFDFDVISSNNREHKKYMNENFTDSFSPINAVPTSSINVSDSFLRPTGIAHQRLIYDKFSWGWQIGFTGNIIEIFGVNTKDKKILSSFWLDNKK